MPNTNRVIRRPRAWWDVIQPGLDSCAIIASLAAVAMTEKGVIEDSILILGLIATILFLITARIVGLHRQDGIQNVDDEISSIAVAWILTVLCLSFLGFLAKTSDVHSRVSMVAWAIVAPATIGMCRMATRIVYQGILKRGIGVCRVAIAGRNELGRQVENNLLSENNFGWQPIGFYDDRKVDRDGNGPTRLPLIGGWDQMVADARDGKIDTVLITLPMRAEDRIRGVLDRLSDSTVSVYVIPDFFVFELHHSSWKSIGGLPAVSIFENPLRGIDGSAKRVTDVALASLGLVVVAIPMLLIALAIKLTSAGPVFFRQKRYGLDGREILVWKFRSMRTCDNGPVVKQATKNDPRITRVGAILRRTSLDELPQLFNVLDGSMSLVGPRPHASAHNEQYRTLIRGYMLRHKVKPGITGLAQVSGSRGETDTIEKMQRRIELDHEYIRAWSLWLDFRILMRTLIVAWRQPEAY